MEPNRARGVSRYMASTPNRVILGTALALLLAACAGEEIPTEGQRTLARSGYQAYEAILLPVQAGPGTARVGGRVRVETDGELMFVRVDAHGLAPGAAYAQQLRGRPAGAAGACPAGAADLDGSGVVDPAEVTAGAGPVLVAFDAFGDPTPESAGVPVADGAGRVQWERIGSMAEAQAVVRTAFGPAAALLPLDRRQIVLQTGALPVACGQLQRVR